MPPPFLRSDLGHTRQNHTHYWYGKDLGHRIHCVYRPLATFALVICNFRSWFNLQYQSWINLHPSPVSQGLKKDEECRMPDDSVWPVGTYHVLFLRPPFPIMHPLREVAIRQKATCRRGQRGIQRSESEIVSTRQIPTLQEIVPTIIISLVVYVRPIASLSWITPSWLVKTSQNSILNSINFIFLGSLVVEITKLSLANPTCASRDTWGIVKFANLHQMMRHESQGE